MRRRMVALGAFATALGSSGVWLATDGGWFRRLPMAAPLVVSAAFEDRADTLRRDEPLATLFARRGVEGSDLYQLLRAAPEVDPRRTRAGQVFDFRYPLGARVPVRVAVRLDADRLLRLTRHAGGWRGEIERVAWSVSRERTAGAIESSLYEALHAAIPDSVLSPPERDRFIADLADGVYGWAIDFSRDLASGDRFALLWERLRSSEGEVRYGRLLAARMETRRAANLAYLVPDGAGGNTYFDGAGISLRRAFKRNPVAYLRISSGYTSRRFHPVLGLWRAHRGTDYAARPGTEIYATGDGTVRVAGRNGGYGLMVAIRHPRGIETRYAHMLRLRRGIHAGARVVQGQVIGYVGASGLASGPHVHYEFLKNGRQLDARSVDLGGGTPLPPGRRGEFGALRARYDRLLEPEVSAPVANAAR